MLKVLIDTSFLLPSLGIDVEEALKGLKILNKSKVKVYYSQFSILEALWVTTKLAKKGQMDQERVEEGLKSIIESARYERIIEDSNVFSNSLKLYLKGHRDMIDNILYAYSVRYDLKLLTLDSELKNFIQERGLKNTLITPEEIV